MSVWYHYLKIFCVPEMILNNIWRFQSWNLGMKSLFSLSFLFDVLWLGVIVLVSIHLWVKSSSSSSCHAASTDIPDPVLPLLPIVYRLRQIFRATSRILTELLYVCSSWSSCFCSAIKWCTPVGQIVLLYLLLLLISNRIMWVKK